MSNLRDSLQSQPCKELALFHQHLPKEMAELFAMILINADQCIMSDHNNYKQAAFDVSQDLFSLYKKIYGGTTGDQIFDQVLDDLGTEIEEMIFDNGETQYFVNVYLQDLAYGGPEEGGWWYTTWTKDRTSMHPSYAEALAYLPQVQLECDELNKNRRSDISSVASEGKYVCEVDIVPAYDHHNNEGYS